MPAAGEKDAFSGLLRNDSRQINGAGALAWQFDVKVAAYGVTPGFTDAGAAFGAACGGGGGAEANEGGLTAA